MKQAASSIIWELEKENFRAWQKKSKTFETGDSVTWVDPKTAVTPATGILLSQHIWMGKNLEINLCPAQHWCSKNLRVRDQETTQRNILMEMKICQSP
jgi:hypothetical protein